ncbi:PDZ domain-containing protein [Zobellia nedashkovskayae]
MSYQAPFVDAATSVDPVNRENTFISYYSYGSVLGLALDLSLREEKLNLDDFMKLVWKQYGKAEKPYVIENLQQVLAEYAGIDFASTFFNKYIYKSEMPDYSSLLNSVGVTLKQNSEEPYFGAAVSLDGDGHGEIQSNPKMESPAYISELDKGDIITDINGNGFPDGQQFSAYIQNLKVGDTLKLSFNRFGVEKHATLTLKANPDYHLFLIEKDGKAPSKKQLHKRNNWLKTEY